MSIYDPALSTMIAHVTGAEEQREIALLKAEVERLRAKLKDTASAREIMSEHAAMLREFALKAEVERLRAALKEITGEPDISKAQGIAHAALRGEGE